MPLLTVAKRLQDKSPQIEILYIGSGNALEKKLSEEAKIPYKEISTGKLRRYFDLKNIQDFFRFSKGIWQSHQIIKKYKPELVFSKGGFVSLPVCLAAHYNKIPIILHESDIAMGLANRIIARIAKHICLTFNQIPAKDKHKYIFTGTPVRKEILKGKKQATLQKLDFSSQKPTLLIMGGSQGAQFINELIYKNLKELLSKYQIIHICGKGKRTLIKEKDYHNFEYVDNELADFYAVADLIISRAGANSLAEISALHKPNILIPLPSSANNHQFKNAEFFAKREASVMLQQKNITNTKFLEKIEQIISNKKLQNMMQENLKKLYNPNSTEEIVEVITSEL